MHILILHSDLITLVVLRLLGTQSKLHCSWPLSILTTLLGYVKKYTQIWASTVCSKSKKKSKHTAKDVNGNYQIRFFLAQHTQLENNSFLADRYVEGICPHCGFEVCVSSSETCYLLIPLYRMLVETNVMAAVAL